MLGLNYDPARAAALREEYGLDKPVVAQYGIWLANLARGNFGTTANGRPVATAVGEAPPVTLELATLALNGLGRLILGAVRGREYALVQASILLIGVAFLVINLAIDLLYAVIDPRLRTGEKGAT